MSDASTDNTVPADPEEPMYEQLGEAGNPLSGSEQGRETEQPDIDPRTEDEVDRAAHHD